ncbi:MAG TPA: Phenylacetic acid catabolic protein [Thermoanaerobaculia bacterium]|nr:Phenylacetic acid catabolic protein [Thermoanaerobaculia bacterium]
MANVTTTELPKKYHDAVLRWKELFLPDYDYLLDNWQRFFPRDPRFQLCAYRELGMPCTVEVGQDQGKPKAERACEMRSEAAQHLIGAIRAQASTEFGSIQQHQLTLARAQDEDEQAMVLRMMAEELRHGYQMLHLLIDDDWSSVSQQSSADMVEEILSMTTGSHVLGAFNIAFDSFVDSIVFCAMIDRVGKYQLQMQQISAYKPMAESMPPMLREEAFHLAAGVVPMRRWVQQAAAGEAFMTIPMLQHTINKWLPRGLEMFGDERGGASNVRMGLKPMKNAEAQDAYYAELEKLIRDLNVRYLRARLPELQRSEVEALLERLLTEGVCEHGVRPEDLLYTPHKSFFRRRGMPAFSMVGSRGEIFDDVEAYLRHLCASLPESYVAGKDFRDYARALRRVRAGEITIEDASRHMPALKRVGGTCPCSRSVRWVVDDPAPGPEAGVAA